MNCDAEVNLQYSHTVILSDCWPSKKCCIEIDQNRMNKFAKYSVL